MIRSATMAMAALALATPAFAQLSYEQLDDPDMSTAEQPESTDTPDNPVDATEVEALADQVNRAIVACFEQTLDAEGRATQAELTGRGMTFSDEAPQAVKDLASAETMGGARYAQWGGADAVIWMIAYTRAPACRLMVAETRLAQAARDGIESRLLESGIWRRNDAQSTTSEGIRRQIFFLDTAEDAPNDLLLSMTGPVAVERNGDGLQMMVTLAALPRTQTSPPASTPAETPSEDQGR